MFIQTHVRPSNGHGVQIGLRLTSDVLTTAQSVPKNGFTFDMKYSENMSWIRKKVMTSARIDKEILKPEQHTFVI